MLAHPSPPPPNAPSAAPDTAAPSPSVVPPAQTDDDTQPDPPAANGVSGGAVSTDGEGREGPAEAGTPSSSSNHRPAKRRKTVDTRATSPPWKTPTVDGPTSFTLNGKRVSARTNAVPLELQAPSGKRTTRAAAHGGSTAAAAAGPRSRYGGATAVPTPSATAAGTAPATPAPKPAKHGRTSSRGAAAAVHSSPVKSSPRPKSQPTPSITESPRTLSKRTRRPSSKLRPERTPSPPPPSKSRSPESKRKPGRPRKQPIAPQPDSTPASADNSEADDEHEGDRAGPQDSPSRPAGRTPRLKFNVKRPTLRAQQPQNMAKEVPYASLRAWYDDHEPADPSNPHPPLSEGRLSDAQVRAQAGLRNRIVAAARPGGALAAERAALFLPEAAEEPERQWAHHDRLLKHFDNFRGLLERERRRHRAEARRLAEACLARWRELQPAPPESAAAFEARLSRFRMAACLADLEGKVEALRKAVLAWRVERLHEQKAVEDRANLMGFLQQSTRVMDSIQGLDASSGDEGPTSDGDSHDRSSAEEQGSENEENMSTDNEDEEAANGTDNEEDPDADLTAEQLRAKYGPAQESRMEWQAGETAASNDLSEGEGTPVPKKSRRSRRKAGSTGDQSSVDGGMDSSEDVSDESVDMDSEASSDQSAHSSHEGSDAQDSGSSTDADPTLGLAGFFGIQDREKLVAQLETENPSEAGVLKTGDVLVNGHDIQARLEGINENSRARDASKTNGAPSPALPARKLAVRHAIISPAESQDGRNGPPSQVYSAPLLPVPFQAVAADDGSEAEEELDEVSMVEYPDIVQVQTPSASNSEGAYAEVRKEVEVVPIVKAPTPPKRETSVPTEELPQQEEDASLVDAPTPPHEESEPEEAFPAFDNEEPASSTKPSEQQEIENVVPASPSSVQPFRTPTPGLLRGKLREYQHHGLDWMAGLYSQGSKHNAPGGILADEMGLGKTIQTIALFAHLAEQHEQWGPHLVIVPTSVVINWEMEFKKFLPGFKVLVYLGATADQRRQLRKGWLDDNKWNVVIAPYSVIHSDQHSFKRRKWHYMVLDEAHHIKNWRSQKWQTMLTFKAYRRLLLTGTPLQNNIAELWSLMAFLMPPNPVTGEFILPGLQEFSSHFGKPVHEIMELGNEILGDAAKEQIKQLHHLLRPYILRRLKADVEKQMPRKYEHVVYCKLSKRQRYLYDGFMSRTETKATLASGNYMSIINCLMQLRKVCNHPDLFETRPIVTSFAMSKAAVADFEIKELLVRRRLLQDADDRNVSLDVINLLPGANGRMSALETIQKQRLGALGNLRRWLDLQCPFISPTMPLNGSTVSTTMVWAENQARYRALEDLRHWAYLTSLRSQRRPLMSFAAIDSVQCGIKRLPNAPRPALSKDLSAWALNSSEKMVDLVKTLPHRSELMQPLVQRFSCVTPAVVAPRMSEFALSKPVIERIRQAQPAMPLDDASGSPPDAFHEARMRLSIAFPDRRLLQWDCGKLQRLALLLRQLQAGGHRALIFTQMTKVLDLLEQFLNIHGHLYLRLDGSTKPERRWELTERFNQDPRILCFILSSRSGGLGINLTGADTVIFYDLDWNPAMDKQCQDRCHRIGQTRDVHVYRLVSEHTVEANILRKSNQKRRLDDVIIQEGDFTTEGLARAQQRLLQQAEEAEDVEGDPTLDAIEADGAAMVDRALGTGARPTLKALAQAEDHEDAAAARVAVGEDHEAEELDHADFGEAGGALKVANAAATTGAEPKPMPVPPSPAAAADQRHVRTARGAPLTSDTYLRGTVAPSGDAATAEAEEDLLFQGAAAAATAPLGVDRFLLQLLLAETAGPEVMEALERAAAGAGAGGATAQKKKKKKKGTEHIVAKKKGY